MYMYKYSLLNSRSLLQNIVSFVGLFWRSWHDVCLIVIRLCIKQRAKGWLRWVSSLKLYISFAKEPCKRDCILQKRPIIWRSPLIVASPYIQCEWVVMSVCPDVRHHDYMSYYMIFSSLLYTSRHDVRREVGAWGRDPKKCTGRDWGMGSSTI